MTTRRPQGKKTPVILRGTAKSENSPEMVISEPAAEAPEAIEPVVDVIDEEAPDLERAVTAAGFAMATVVDAPTPELLSAAEAWRSRTLQLLGDNTKAWLDLAGALGKAPTAAELAQLQAQFACERFCALLQASNDYFSLTREAAEDTLRAFPKLFVAA